MKKFYAIMSLSAATLPTTVAADCAPYVGTIVATGDIDQVMQPFEDIGPKGEFETTTDYEARREAAVSSLGNIMIIEKAPEGRENIIYNADAGRMDIVTFAFSNMGFDARALFGARSPYAGQVPYSSQNIQVVIKQDEKVTSTYRASNGFGATTEVSKIFRISRAIYEGPAPRGAHGLFPQAENRPYIAGSIPMSPETARRLKPEINFAYVVAPKPPYFLSTVYDYGVTPTVSNPREVGAKVSAFIADIQCGLVLDAENKVLGAFATR